MKYPIIKFPTSIDCHHAMSRCFSLRPQSLTFGVPGIGRTKAHDDKRSGTRQTLHKLTTLDPLAAQKELQSDPKHSALKAKILIERMNGVEANVPATPPSPTVKAIASLGGKVAIAVGLKHRKPQPHTQLLRYTGTQPSGGPALEDEAASQTPANLHDLIPVLVRTFEHEETLLHAQIGADHAAGVDAALTREINRIQEEDVGLAARRAVNLADQARKCGQQRNALTVLLQREHEATATAIDALNAIQAKLPEATQALDRALLVLEKKTDRQSAAVSHLEQNLENARQYARQAAVTLHFGRASPTQHLLERGITHANEKIETIQSELANARAELLALQQLRQDVQLLSDFSPTPPADSSLPANRTPDADAHEASLLAQRVAQLKRDNNEQLAAMQVHQARVQDFERRLRDVETQLKQALHSSKIDESMHYAVAETQLENFLEQARAFTKENKLATMYVDYTLKAEAAPILDAVREAASLWRKAGREDLAQRAERDFDDLMTEPALWEPAILVLREKTKLQVERGIDFFIKAQRNRLAESQRTVGQWVQYEPVERAEPGQQIDYVRTWMPEEPEDEELENEGPEEPALS